MAVQADYRSLMKADLSALIDALELSAFQKQVLRSRWLDQLLWMEGRADAARDWYYRLRLTTIVGGVVLPALVSLNEGVLRWVTIGVSVLIALSAAIEEFFHYGERWRHYRRTVERLKTEGWQFFQMSGSYRRFKSHRDAHPLFSARVEEIIQRDVEQYVTTVVPEQEEEGKTKPTGSEGVGAASASAPAGGRHGLS